MDDCCLWMNRWLFVSFIMIIKKNWHWIVDYKRERIFLNDWRKKRFTVETFLSDFFIYIIYLATLLNIKQRLINKGTEEKTMKSQGK